MKYGINGDNINHTALQLMLAEVLRHRAVHSARPDHFYLVTTNEKKPKPIGIMGGKESRIRGYPMDHSYLDTMFPGVANRVIDQLSNIETAPAKNDLIKLYPRILYSV